MLIENKTQNRHYLTNNQKEAFFLFIFGEVISGIEVNVTPWIYSFNNSPKLEFNVELYKKIREQFDNPDEYIFNGRG